MRELLQRIVAARQELLGLAQDRHNREVLERSKLPGAVCLNELGEARAAVLNAEIALCKAELKLARFAPAAADQV